MFGRHLKSRTTDPSLSSLYTKTMSGATIQSLPSGEYLISRKIEVPPFVAEAEQVVHSTFGSPIKLTSQAVAPVYVSTHNPSYMLEDAAMYVGLSPLLKWTVQKKEDGHSRIFSHQAGEPIFANVKSPAPGEVVIGSHEPTEWNIQVT